MRSSFVSVVVMRLWMWVSCVVLVMVDLLMIMRLLGLSC